MGIAAAEASIGTAVFATVTTASATTAAVDIPSATTTRRTRTATPPAIATRPDITIDGETGAITPVATPIRTIPIKALILLDTSIQTVDTQRPWRLLN